MQERNYEELACERGFDLARSLENCMSAITHARNMGMPIAFTRHAERYGSFERSAAWISGFEPKRADMVFERQQPSCYANQLFDAATSRVHWMANTMDAEQHILQQTEVGLVTTRSFNA